MMNPDRDSRVNNNLSDLVANMKIQEKVSWERSRKISTVQLYTVVNIYVMRTCFDQIADSIYGMILDVIMSCKSFSRVGI